MTEAIETAKQPIARASRLEKPIFAAYSKNVVCRKGYQLNIKNRFQAFFGKIPALFNVQAFFATILARFSAVSKLNEISWKSVRKCEISRKSVPENGLEIEDRKSKVAEYSKMPAELPSEQIFTEITL